MSRSYRIYAIVLVIRPYTPPKTVVYVLHEEL